jgi:hypothetical protein
MVTQQCDQRLARRIGGADHGMHERLANALVLTIRQNADRAEPKGSELADPPASADHVADDPLITGRHQ